MCVPVCAHEITAALAHYAKLCLDVNFVLREIRKHSGPSALHCPVVSIIH